MVEARFFLKNPNFQLRDFGTSESRHILKREGLLIEVKTAGNRHGFRVLGVK